MECETIVIRKLPNKNVFILKSKKTGRELGRFKSRESAIKRERQIEYFKRVKQNPWRYGYL